LQTPFAEGALLLVANLVKGVRYHGNQQVKHDYSDRQGHENEEKIKQDFVRIDVEITKDSHLVCSLQSVPNGVVIWNQLSCSKRCVSQPANESQKQNSEAQNILDALDEHQHVETCASEALEVVEHVRPQEDSCPRSEHRQGYLTHCTHEGRDDCDRGPQCGQGPKAHAFDALLCFNQLYQLSQWHHHGEGHKQEPPGIDDHRPV